ncbi:GID complex subunit containing RING finger motif [Mucor velutinosus]|uniref:GID complex subunit containing RING finger motif n=1 Tax=Mucor velutinosus TaxID=708070 RepID=A0AAN7I4E0_9FUNG|nr:GID complex subunit containing RING finger motif [Mucor velutinosus]
MKEPAEAIKYLNKTKYENWDFANTINLIKEELGLNNTQSYTILDCALKNYFKKVKRAKEWVSKWKSLIKQYEKSEQTTDSSISYNVNVNTAQSIINSYQEIQTICAFTDKPIATSDMPTTESDTLIATSDTPTTGSGTPTTESDTPTTESGTPTTESDTPTTESEKPIATSKKTADEDKFTTLFNDDDDDDDDDDNDDDTGDGDDDATDRAEIFRKELYKAAYQYFKGGQDLFTVAILNRMAQNVVPRTLSESLDLLSYQLLTKEMNANEKNTLKLSISRVICFSGPTAAIFKAYFNKQSQHIRDLFEQAKSHNHNISAVVGLSEKAK